MTLRPLLVGLALAGLGLAGCADPNAAGPGAAPTATAPAPSPAEAACTEAVNIQIGDGSARVARADRSGPDTVLFLRDSREDGTWRCLVSGAGAVQALTFQGDPAGGGGRTAVAAPRGDTPEQTACLAAVASEANTGDVAVLSSQFSQAGTLVMVGVGPRRAPWRCIAYADGTTDGIRSETGEGVL